MVYRVL